MNSKWSHEWIHVWLCKVFNENGLSVRKFSQFSPTTSNFLCFTKVYVIFNCCLDRVNAMNLLHSMWNSCHLKWHNVATPSHKCIQIVNGEKNSYIDHIACRSPFSKRLVGVVLNQHTPHVHCPCVSYAEFKRR